MGNNSAAGNEGFIALLRSMSGGSRRPSFSLSRKDSCRSRRFSTASIDRYGWGFWGEERTRSYTIDSLLEEEGAESQLKVQLNLFDFIQNPSITEHPQLTIYEDEDQVDASKKIIFSADQTQAAIGCKAFVVDLAGDEASMWCASTVCGVRIVQTHAGEHAEFKTAVALGNALFVVWKRYSDFKEMACYARQRRKAMPCANSAWDDVLKGKKWARSFNIAYLVHKGELLQDFLQCFQFEVDWSVFAEQLVGESAAGKRFLDKEAPAPGSRVRDRAPSGGAMLSLRRQATPPQHAYPWQTPSPNLDKATPSPHPTETPSPNPVEGMPPRHPGSRAVPMLPVPRPMHQSPRNKSKSPQPISIAVNVAAQREFVISPVQTRHPGGAEQLVQSRREQGFAISPVQTSLPNVNGQLGTDQCIFSEGQQALLASPLNSTSDPTPASSGKTQLFSPLKLLGGVDENQPHKSGAFLTLKRNKKSIAGDLSCLDQEGDEGAIPTI
mmetsp:Transcript_16322/g.25739  ORF Transcript_16322/g.25739 Transcript_16322/m.25739 type:complete len:496 (+) Transcript_16322:23-1510(+)